MTINFGRLLSQTTREMSRVLDTYAHNYGITGVQLSILDFVGNVNNAPIQHDVELEFNIQRATATVLLQRMERDGLIVRIHAPTDGRQKLIKLTPRGQELAERAAAHFDAQQHAIEQHFTPEQLSAFQDALNYFKHLQ